MENTQVIDNQKTKKPGRGMKTLVKVTYKEIAKWSGLKVSTARNYAFIGEYDPTNLASILNFCNRHRRRRGMPLLCEDDFRKEGHEE